MYILAIQTPSTKNAVDAPLQIQKTRLTRRSRVHRRLIVVIVPGRLARAVVVELEMLEQLLQSHALIIREVSQIHV